MGFAGVYVAVYDYAPRAENELEIREGDLLYLIEKSAEDAWWKAKRKAAPDEDEEPEGLVPSNYVEEAHPVSHAKALYDYTRQTDEEVSFAQDAVIEIYDTSDPDWTLVRVGAEYGFAPANYIEVVDGAAAHDAGAAAAAAATPAGEQAYDYHAHEQPAYADAHDHEHPHVPVAVDPNTPAAAIADILHGRQPSLGSAAGHAPRRDHAYPADDSDDERRPTLPQRPVSVQAASELAPRREREREREREMDDPRAHRPRSMLPEETAGVQPSPPYGREGHATPSKNFPSGYHLYNISESVTVMGKKKKLPTTLGINVNQGMILISRAKDDDRMEQWSVDKLAHYSIEGKHVFLDLVRPSKSIDFHAGAKDTAQEIVSLLGEIAGRYRAEGLREVIAAGKGGGIKRGVMLYDFDAQGDDEVSVRAGDDVLILDDAKSEEWWVVRRAKNGLEGVVPSSYIEVTAGAGGGSGALPGGLSLAEQGRLEEERLAREALRKSSRKSQYDAAGGYGAERSKKEYKDSKGKSKPDPSKLRKWTDRSGSFNVVAQFKGLHDNKITLHKENGVQIAVPVSKMSVADLEYVEAVTGVSLDEDKPLSAVKAARSANQPAKSVAGAVVAPEPSYDWFDFFLKAGVPPQFCERYAQNFVRDSMDESVLPDITTENLRTLGLKEGDILRVMKYLDNMFGRAGGKSKLRSVTSAEDVAADDDAAASASGGLFSGPGGTLHNNTRKARPAPAVQASDVVDPKVFETKDAAAAASSPKSKTDSPAPTTRGFDDDAWEVKRPAAASPARTESPAAGAPPAAAAAAAAAPAVAKAEEPKPPTGAMADLSLLQAPLQPTPAQPAQPAVAAPVVTAAPAPAAAPAPVPVSAPAPAQTMAQPAAQQGMAPMGQMVMGQPTGAGMAFYPRSGGVAQPQPQPQQMQPQIQQPQMQQPQMQQPMPTQQFLPQMTGFVTQPQQLQPQMTAAMPQLPAATGLMAQQPPARPLSAPQNPPQPVSAFGLMTPIQPQMTGAPLFGNTMLPPRQQLPAPPPPPPFQPQSAFGNAIVAQQTGFQPQQTGYRGALQAQATGFGVPPPPPVPMQPTTLPLTPQRTGPAPPVRFGVQKEKLQPQPTGLRANLAQATPSNPFGF